VVQETLLEAWKHLDRLQSPEGFHAWVDEICRNICRRYARKKQTDLLRYVPLLNPYHLDDDEHGEAEATGILDSHSLDPVEALDRQDLTVLLNRALGALPGTAREVVELCYLLELPQREAATRLGLTISALEAHLHRARLQLRQILSGPLRADAESLGLALDQELAAGWRETRLWCNVCGRRRLQGIFLPQPGGSVNLHLRCPDCSQLSGFDTLHSKGLVQLDGVRSFRPAWKRTMQVVTQQLMQALAQGWYPCPYCGTPASIQLVDKDEVPNLYPGVRATPYQFWVRWYCSRCGEEAFMMSADELVYWSHPLTRQFIMQHPRCLNEPDKLVEYAGQPAIRFQLADMSSTERLTVLADRNTLRVLEIFSQ
jgi:RNA polymerase sigma factor (sigma-70 family)